MAGACPLPPRPGTPTERECPPPATIGVLRGERAIYGLINYEPTMAAAGLAVSMGLLNTGLVWLSRTYLRPRADEKVREMFGIA